MNIYITDPLTDSRWEDLVARHPRASVFHQRAWLEALSKTYGYEPLVLTSASENEPMTDGIALCYVSSWITGSRLVSLPFADHCEPLLKDQRDLGEFEKWLLANREAQGWKYIELRPLTQMRDEEPETRTIRSYRFHELDLTPTLEQLFRNLHKDSIQRRIQRAEREGISYVTGRSEALADDFYRLLLMTRKRHRLLPQPRAWFKNLVEEMGDKAQIRIVRKNEIPIAAMLTLRHGPCVTYKYGCSDGRFHNLGAMPFLFWRLIEESKASGAEKIDLGRSDLEQESLITFKDKLGTTKRLLNYYRYPLKAKQKPIAWIGRAIGQFFSILPDAVSPIAGRLVYKHMG